MAEYILIAEDDTSVAELVKVILETQGYNTVWATDGKDALLKAEQNPPDLILLDVLMPKLNGYEVLKLLKAQDALKHIPVIFLSVKSETDSKVVGLHMGGHDYITKPFDIEELLARVDAALRIKGTHDHLRQNNQRLAELSMTDPLTTLYNKRYLMERFHEELERARRYQFPIACVAIDIDQFQHLNDTFGPLQGDQVLQQLAQLMKSSNRVVDILARFGGEEFLLVLPQTDLGGAEIVARRFLKLITQSRLVKSDPSFKLSVSVGASAFAGDKLGNEEDLLNQALQALAQAKQKGQDHIVCLPA